MGNGMLPGPPSGSVEARPLDFGTSDQPDPSLIREVRIGPLQQHAHAIAEAYQVHDVYEQPEPPREPSRDLESPEIGNRFVPADRRKVALVEVSERNRRLVAQQQLDVLRRALALLIGARRNPRNSDAPSIREVREISDDENLRVAGNGQIRLHHHASHSIQRCPERSAKWRCRIASSPENRARADAVVANARLRLIDLRDDRVQANLDAERLQISQYVR